MSAPAHRPPRIDYDAILKSLEQDDEAPEPSMKDLLRELIDELRGMRRDLKAIEWRRGLVLIHGIDHSNK